MTLEISVVIPAIDEEACVGGAIASARAAGEGIEVIVSDGGSRDATRRVAAAAGACVLEGPRGRGI